LTFKNGTDRKSFLGAAFLVEPPDYIDFLTISISGKT
jgi:hypothetical protein